MKFSAALLLVVTFALPTQAFEFDISNSILEKVIEMPTKNIRAVKSKDQIVFMSENGRYVFTGQVYDIWHSKPLDTIEQIEDSATRLHFDEMKMDVNSMNTVVMGSGPLDVVVFVDPRCNVCHSFMKEAASLVDEYTFKFVVIPAMGAKSHALSKKLFCAKDKSKKLDALMNNNIPMLEKKAQCDIAMYDQTLVFAHFIGIEGVPFVVAPDGRFVTGKPKNMQVWFKGGKQS